MSEISIASISHEACQRQAHMAGRVSAQAGDHSTPPPVPDADRGLDPFRVEHGPGPGDLGQGQVGRFDISALYLENRTDRPNPTRSGCEIWKYC